MNSDLVDMSNQVIFLNGTSSSGKSTIAKLLQDQLKEPYVIMSVDSYYYSMKYPDWITDEIWKKKWPPLFHVGGFHASLLAIWKQGVTIIVDHVLQEEFWFKELSEMIFNEKTIFVGVYCSLEELERREKKRGDRDVGIVRYQYDKVHKNKEYDIRIDTSLSTPQECADKIIDYIWNHKIIDYTI